MRRVGAADDRVDVASGDHGSENVDLRNALLNLYRQRGGPCWKLIIDNRVGAVARPDLGLNQASGLVVGGFADQAPRSVIGRDGSQAVLLAWRESRHDAATVDSEKRVADALPSSVKDVELLYAVIQKNLLVDLVA